MVLLKIPGPSFLAIIGLIALILGYTNLNLILKGAVTTMDKKIPDINKTPQPNPMNFVTPNEDYMPDETKSRSHPKMSSSSKKSWIMKLIGK